MFSIFKKKDPSIEISEELIQKDFLRTVQHYIAFAQAPGKIPLNIATLPMKEGILASISLEDYRIAQDDLNRIILTHVNKTSQIIMDYPNGIMTVTFGYVLFDTIEMPRTQKTDYHG